MSQIESLTVEELGEWLRFLDTLEKSQNARPRIINHDIRFLVTIRDQSERIVALEAALKRAGKRITPKVESK